MKPIESKTWQEQSENHLSNNKPFGNKSETFQQKDLQRGYIVMIGFVGYFYLDCLDNIYLVENHDSVNMLPFISLRS